MSPGRIKNFRLVVLTGSGTHTASYAMGTESKASEA
jgi:hypothetical protein